MKTAHAVMLLGYADAISEVLHMLRNLDTELHNDTTKNIVKVLYETGVMKHLYSVRCELHSIKCGIEREYSNIRCAEYSNR